MTKNTDYMFMMNYVNTFLSVTNTDEIAKSFSEYLQGLDEEDFINKLIYAGYIPDVYKNDSREETLFTKLVEVMTAEWARRMGFESDYIKQKSSYQDVNITIDNKIIVCDSKSFRLGRSQAAPNVKDFLKLADISKWLDRYPAEKRLGGLVVYPCKHEWTKGSDAYQYCSTKAIPTIMLPYKYLAFLLYYSKSYKTNDLKKLWEFDRIFPESLKNKKTNKIEYWNAIDKEIISITNTSQDKLKEFIKYADECIANFINLNIFYLQNFIDTIKKEKKKQLDGIDKRLLEQMLLDLLVKEDAKNIEQSIKNINKFRVVKDEKK